MFTFEAGPSCYRFPLDRASWVLSCVGHECVGVSRSARTADKWPLALQTSGGIFFRARLFETAASSYWSTTNPNIWVEHLSVTWNCSIMWWSYQSLECCVVGEISWQLSLSLSLTLLLSLALSLALSFSLRSIQWWCHHALTVSWQLGKMLRKMTGFCIGRLSTMHLSPLARCAFERQFLITLTLLHTLVYKAWTYQ